ncbi:MAG: isochorismatase family protein [Nitrolancea sp.]
MSQQPARHLNVEADSVGFLLIDAQPAFWSSMYGPREPVMARIEHALLLARSFTIPVIATFEHPVDGKGSLPERLERVFPPDGKRLVKHTFDCCDDKQIRTALQHIEVRQLIVAGAETDVCVLQSVLGLLDMGFQVFLLEDALFSSEPDPSAALRRMYQDGATPITYKSLYYELKGTVDVDPLHLAWNAEFGEGEERYRAPEQLPHSG